MASPYGERDVRFLILSFGLILLLIGIALLASWTQNVFFIPVGFFIIALGMGAVAMGFAGFGGWDRPPMPKVRCRQCFTLNYETSMKCRKCGASMF